jgi:mRNA interferase RelE/StbE
LAFQIKLKKSVLKDLKKLERGESEKILNVIDKELCNDPFKGKALKGKYQGLFRFRIGVYRVIYEIKKSELVVILLRISHRKDAYRGIL